MKTILYIVLPCVAFALIVLNAFFGHSLIDLPYNQDINKYSIYVHLESEWKSYPRNILYEVTDIWSNPNPNESNTSNYDPSISESLVTDYNSNQLEQQRHKSYVELKHEYSNCESSWKPVLYRYVIDSLRNNFEYLQGHQLNNDPYLQILPDVPNNNYDLKTQEDLAKQGFVQFIPICTANNSTSYDYSVSINDPEIGFDVYFVNSSKQVDNYIGQESFSYYPQNDCYALNRHSFSGTCKNVGSDSGLLIIIPDNLDRSLTKVNVNLHENSS